jgi:hypothetical protein
VLAGYSTASKSCFNNQCGQIRQFLSTGNTQSVNLTVEPFWNFGHDWTVGVEAGPAIYVGPWQSDYVADQTGIFGPDRQHAGGFAPRRTAHRSRGGRFGIERPGLLRYNYPFAPSHFVDNGSDVPSGIRDVHMLTLNYTF